MFAVAHSHPTPAVALGIAVQSVGGYATFTHEYWVDAGSHVEPYHPLHALERQLFVASMLASYPIHALVIYNMKMYHVQPMSETPREEDSEPMYIMLHYIGATVHTLALGPGVYNSSHKQSDSMNAKQIVVRGAVAVTQACECMRGFLEYASKVL